MVLPVRTRRRSRIAHFKAPFVVAVLAPVAVLDAGCGAKADQNEEPIDTTPGVNPNPEGCPEHIPAVGAACSHELACRYEACDPGRRCLDGIWQLDGYVSSCNPPWPALETCPESQPEAGTSCAGYEPGKTCEYSYCYELIPLARCGAELLWESIDVPFACNPPPMECPPRAPALGTGCYYLGQQCVYGTCGDLDDPRSAPRCEGGFWVQPEVVLCPGPSIDAGVGSVDGGVDEGVADGG